MIISCVIHGFLALFSTFPNRQLIVSNTHSFIQGPAEIPDDLATQL